MAKFNENITIIGLGLIGGSLAKSIRKAGLFNQIIGVDASLEHQSKAMELGLVDICMDLNKAIPKSQVIVLAVPVDTIEILLPNILDKLENQVVFDVGSTKHSILQNIIHHPRRGRFVACHPMAGTEFSGPEAAIEGLFDNGFNVICNAEQSDEDALKLVEQIFTAIGMNLIYQESEAHDTHVAYVSHISHISAFALALTVLHKEKSEEQIFQLASGGFRSSVRLAKSNPVTWSPIFEKNRDAVLDVLDEHITVLSKFRSLLIKKDFEQFKQLMTEANEIKGIIDQSNNNKNITNTK